MVWGGISNGQRIALVSIQGNLNAVKYRDDILAPYVFRFFRRTILLRSSKTIPQAILLVLRGHFGMLKCECPALASKKS